MSCTKIRYTTKTAARDAMKKLIKRTHDRRATLLHTYWCGTCAAHHIGHRPTVKLTVAEWLLTRRLP